MSALVVALLAAVWLAIAGGESDPVAPAGREAPSAPAATERAALLLFTSLPIYWAEAADVAAMLADRGQAHWARRALEDTHALVPLDTLDAASLAAGRSLAMIQPRPLAPSENVALDAWVNEGGRLLLFADPMLTAPSTYALGDRRRPQDIVLLSPILARWGLALEFDEAQPAGERSVALGRGIGLPVEMAGRFALAPGAAGAKCRLAHRNLVARCRIGKGRVVAVADAALFEARAPEAIAARRAALVHLVAEAFD